MRDRDFILRYIQLFFELVAKALGLFEKKDIVRAEQTIDLAFRQFVGYPLEMIEGMTPPGAAALLSTDPDRRKERLLLAGELLRCRAVIAQEQSNAEKTERAARLAAFLFLEASSMSGLPDIRDFALSLQRLAEFCSTYAVGDPDKTARIAQLGHSLNEPGNTDS
ncbi:MAG: hypothetical protein HY042_13030 [Spirochaetia bacterium]|nr:hypothetical protein [Spirochaetia bacterium]